MTLRPVSIDDPITEDDIGKWAFTRALERIRIDHVTIGADALVFGSRFRDFSIVAHDAWMPSGRFNLIDGPTDNDIVQVLEPYQPMPDKHVGALADSAQILIDALDRWHVIRAGHSVGENPSPAIKAVIDAHKAANDALAAYQAALKGGEG